LERFNDQIKCIFGIEGKARECTTNFYKTYNLGVNNKPLARILAQVGVPIGNKTNVKFLIPYWIIEDKNNFARSINRLFSCEGSVDIKSSCIELIMHNLNRFQEYIGLDDKDKMNRLIEITTNF